MSYTLTPSLPMTVISAQTATTAQGILLIRGNCERVTIVVEGSAATISSGVVTIEEAYYDLDHGQPVYGGTWGPITTVNGSDVTGGKQLVVHLTGSFWAIRARISTTIAGGGTVTVYAWGN